MKVFAISDLHLSINNPKPMDIFGPAWDNYLEAIEKDWNKKVGADDVVLIPGDISWAMRLQDAYVDLEYISRFNGKKVFIKGNHDYWWGSISEIRSKLDESMFAIQNDAIKFGEYIICGTRGWSIPEGNYKTEQDEKIYRRELIRMELSLKSAKALQENNEKIIVMTHFPPMNVKCEKNDMTELFVKYGVNAVVYGHLHNFDKGAKLSFVKNKIKYYLTSCDLVGNKLTRIIIK